jgi:hypothetical protein
MAKDIAVFCVYPDRGSLEGGIARLRAADFRERDISVLADSKEHTHDLAHELHTKAPEGAVAGASVGGAVGGAAGWLLSLGELAIPGAGPFIAAGPIVATLAGLGAGATTGGLIGALAAAGVPEVEVKLYEGRVRKGSILCAVHCDDSTWADRARTVLKDSGGEHLTATI